MRFDERTYDQPLSIDIAPLIDVVFLLLLFFAISVPLMETKKVEVLKESIAETESQNRKLISEIAKYADRIEIHKNTIQELESKLNRSFVDNEKTTAAGQYQTKSLRSQLILRKSEIVRLGTIIEELENKNEQLRSNLEAQAREKNEVEEDLAEASDNLRELGIERNVLEAERLWQRISAKRLRETLSRLEKEFAAYKATVQIDRDQVKRLAKIQNDLQEDLGEYLNGNRLGMRREGNRLILKLPDRVLFESGSAIVKSEGLDVLRSVGDVLRTKLKHLMIQIGGHTDNVPMSGAGRSRFSSNWELSAARAVNVVRFLKEEIGLDPIRMSAVGYSEFRPLASNQTTEGRAANRRIEIVLLEP